MNNVDKQYLDLLREVLETGTKKSDRTGTGTISKFGKQLRFNLQDGFPILTTKKIHLKSVVHELLWFLRGDQNIKYLVDNGVSIWNEWPWQKYCKERESRLTMLSISIKNSDIYQDTIFEVANMKTRVDEMPPLTIEQFTEKIKNDVEFASKWGDLGPVYGKQWINWEYPIRDERVYKEGSPSGDTVFYRLGSKNQIQQVIDDLTNNPDSRRIMVNAWNPGEIDNVALPPCLYGFQFWKRELSEQERLKIWEERVKGLHILLMSYNGSFQEELDKQNIPRRAVSMSFHMRSIDLFLGLPFNISSYALLLHMIAQSVNMVPEELVWNGGDCHIYSNHVDQVNEQLTKEPMDLPKVWLNPEVKNIFDFRYDDVKLVDYKSHASIKAPIAI